MPNFDRSLSVNIRQKYDGILNDIQDETEIEHSQAAQYCIFKQKAETAKRSDLLDRGAEREAVRTWTELKGSLVEPQINLHHVISKRFGPQRSTTIYFLQNDPQPFGDWARLYQNQFYETYLYDELCELFGDSTFTNVENVIEEYTSVKFRIPEKTRFLADVPDELGRDKET